MLQLQIIGNLTRDAEVKEINSYTYITFTAACEAGRDKTTFVSVLKRIGENSGLAQYLTKGKKVYVQGRLAASAYINNAGEAMPDVTVWADNIELLGGRDNNNVEQTNDPF